MGLLKKVSKVFGKTSAKADDFSLRANWQNFWEEVEEVEAIYPSLADLPSMAILQEWFQRLDIQNKTVIDFGCGEGKLFPHIEYAAKILAVDWSSKALLKARRTGMQNVDFVNVDIRDFTIEGKVDVGICLDGISPENPVDVMILLAKMMMQIRQGGHFIFVAPSFESHHMTHLYPHYTHAEDVNLRKSAEIQAVSRFESPFGWLNIHPMLPMKAWTQNEIIFLMRHFFDAEVLDIKKMYYPRTLADQQFPIDSKVAEDTWYWAFLIRNTQDFTEND